MKISIIGSGKVGSALQKLFQAAGHSVIVGSRSLATESEIVGIIEAASRAEIIVLAVPFHSLTEVLEPIGQMLRGKIVIDPTNPLNADWSPLLLGQENSAGEETERLLPGARIVKAFNTVFADVMIKERILRNGQPVTAFVASNDEDAADIVAALANSVGFSAVKVGPLSASRYLEALAHLNIAIALGQGGRTNSAFIYHQAV
jgi:8-hydroxy-5-deazaflavin:NADPH oxidoreductase